MLQTRAKEVRFWHALLPILALWAAVLYGLIVRPLALDQPALALEIVFLAASAFAIIELFLLGHSWTAVQGAIVAKLGRAMPAFFILFAIGIIISSWIVSGTIPMLVYYGIQVIDARFLYLLCFWIPILFSTLTGTSWGSAGTIGVVLMGVSQVLGGDLGITAGAIIGGAYFGDKMSPLSDTTNLAALAAEVDLYDHIRSMMYTTLPSAVLASILFGMLGFVYPAGASGSVDWTFTESYLRSLHAIFHFNPFLLLPPLVVVIGSLRRMPTIPTLGASVLSAAALALLFQDFSLSQILSCLHRGFNSAQMVSAGSVPPEVASLLDRGGLYALVEPIVIAVIIFVFTGALDLIGAMPLVVGRLLGFVRRRSTTILASLAASALANAMTSNQYATTFIVADAFKSKYDQAKIPRQVLSRSIEDLGTMVESVIPWTATTAFLVATLGVPHSQYWHWQLLSLINFVVAPTLAILGIGCYYNNVDSSRRS